MLSSIPQIFLHSFIEVHKRLCPGIPLVACSVGHPVGYVYQGQHDVFKVHPAERSRELRQGRRQALDVGQLCGQDVPTDIFQPAGESHGGQLFILHTERCALLSHLQPLQQDLGQSAQAEFPMGSDQSNHTACYYWSFDSKSYLWIVHMTEVQCIPPPTSLGCKCTCWKVGAELTKTLCSQRLLPSCMQHRQSLLSAPGLQAVLNVSSSSTLCTNHRPTCSGLVNTWYTTGRTGEQTVLIFRYSEEKETCLEKTWQCSFVIFCIHFTSGFSVNITEYSSTLSFKLHSVQELLNI